MIRAREHGPAAPVAGEQQRTAHRTGLGPESYEQLLEVLVGSRRIAHLEADGPADLHSLPDHDCTLLPVGSHDAADEEVAPLMLLGVLVHRDPDVQPPRNGLPIL